MFKVLFDYSNYIEEITAGQVTDHIKSLNEPIHVKEFELPDLGICERKQEPTKPNLMIFFKPKNSWAIQM